MKKCILFPALTAALSAAGFFLRGLTSVNGLDSRGLPVADTSWILLIAVTVIAVIAAICAARACKASAVSDEALAGGTLSLLCGIAAVGLCVAGGLFSFRESDKGLLRFGGILVTVGAMGWLGVLAARKRKAAPSPWLQFPMLIGLTLIFIDRFRRWSIDPIIGDHAWLLLASVTILLGLYYLAGFALSCGKPRRTLFFAAAAVFFTVTSLSDAAPAQMLVNLGCSLWLAVPAIRLLSLPEKAAEETNADSPEPNG